MTNAKTTAKAKTAKAKVTANVETITTTTTAGVALAQIFVASAAVRTADAEKCKTILTDSSAFADASFSRQLDAVIANGYMTAEALEALAHDLAVTEKSDSRFIGLKVITKVRQALYALANNRKSFFDGYTNSILSNLVRLQELTNKGALQSLSKSIEYDELNQVSDIRRVIDCSPSTASTQASSSRMMLRALGLANVQKRKNGDVLTMNESAGSRAVVALYTL